MHRTAFAILGAVLLSSGATAAQQTADAVKAFDTIQTVLQSPRCVNCHIAGDAPLQGDAGAPHTQGVVRGKEGKGVPGLACADCHGMQTTPASYGPAMPPGAPGWHRPPESMKMVFQNLSKAELSATLKDSARNGGKSLDAFVAHFEKDPLVLWGWSPGEMRTPVPVPHADLVTAVKTWVAAGGPCTVAPAK